MADDRFPVAVMEPGLGLSAVQMTTVAENLASHGFIVAGVTPTYSANLTVLDSTVLSATPRGNPAEFGADDGDRLVAVWARDAVFAAHTDGEQTVYLGHSLSGAASLQACAWDRTCQAAVDLDGSLCGEVVDTGLSVPYLVLGSENSCTTGFCRPATAEDKASRDAARGLREAGTGTAQCLALRGTGHLNFTDYGAHYLADPLAGLAFSATSTAAGHWRSPTGTCPDSWGKPSPAEPTRCWTAATGPIRKSISSADSPESLGFSQAIAGPQC